jgi:hypothetical protein
MHRLLRRVADTAWLTPFVSLLALLLTVSMTVPVTTMLLPTVLLAPRRWRAVVCAGAIGSALGATLLAIAFHHLGWAQMYAAFPALEQSARWVEIMNWTRLYGVFALFAVAALPLPQTPALVFCAITDLPTVEVFAAILAGKLIKYGVLGVLTSRMSHLVGPSH